MTTQLLRTWRIAQLTAEWKEVERKMRPLAEREARIINEIAAIELLDNAEQKQN